MQRFITSLLSAITLAVAAPASATTYGGYVRNWWVQENGDITFYFLDATNSNWVVGLCGSPLYVLQAGKTSFDETYSSLLLAAKNNFKVLLDVTTCSGNQNLIRIAKVCTWTGDC